jgi:hypothetical protein
MDRAFAIGNGAAGSVRVNTGGARRRICVAAPPLSLEDFRRNRIVPFDFSCLHGRKLHE